MHRVAALLVLLTLVGAAGAGAAPEKRYLRISADGNFSLRLEYGSDPRAVYNGSWFKSTSYKVRAIVVFDGRTASLLPGASMVIAGSVFVNENRTLWVRVGSRKRVECKSPGVAEFEPGSGSYFTQTGPGERASFVFAKGGGVSVSSGGLKVDTGAAIKGFGCAATEALETHGLPGGPSFTVSPPAKSRFSGSKPFSITCNDEYSHPFTTTEPNGNHHSFTGSAQATVTFTPFPATNIANVKKALRDSVGKKQPSGQDFGNAKDCLRG